jgi:hypothetical protein
VGEGEGEGKGEREKEERRLRLRRAGVSMGGWRWWIVDGGWWMGQSWREVGSALWLSQASSTVWRPCGPEGEGERPH